MFYLVTKVSVARNIQRRWRIGGKIVTGKSEILEENPVPVSLCLPEIPIKWPVIIRWNPASSTNRFTTRESATGMHLEREFVGHRFSLDSVVKKGISCLQLEWNPSHPSPWSFTICTRNMLSWPQHLINTDENNNFTCNSYCSHKIIPLALNIHN